MLRLLTAGESHGKALVSILDGFPSGLELDLSAVNAEMERRQQGYGRSARQKIESDSVEFLGGLRHGITTGAPLAMFIRNRDWDNWQHVMSSIPPQLDDPSVQEQLTKKLISSFRPGHADLPGTLKFKQRDIRDVLERASARETAARVAAGAVCAQLLEHCGISITAAVTKVGGIASTLNLSELQITDIKKNQLDSKLFCVDADAELQMLAVIDEARRNGDTVGGVIEIHAEGCPVGLGSCTQWDERLDGQLAQALMSIQAIKAVEVGDGIDAAQNRGSQVHDAIYAADEEQEQEYSLPFSRQTNRAGGIEGGMTNGERVVLRAFMKPIPTLAKGLPSVSFPEFKPDAAHFERSDVCAIAAASVVAKAMVSFVLARTLLQKFGSDTVTDILSSLNKFRSDCANLGAS
jgi:chorismate synthase